MTNAGGRACVVEVATRMRLWKALVTGLAPRVRAGRGTVLIDLGGAIVGWLIQILGNAGVRLVRGSPDEQALNRAVESAIENVVQEADPASRDVLARGLAECFSSHRWLRLGTSATSGEELRRLIARQVIQLSQMVNTDTGQSFYQDIATHPNELAWRVADAVLDSLRRVLASGGLAELLRSEDMASVLARLDALGLQIGQRTSSTSDAVRTLPRDIASFTGRRTELTYLMDSVTDARRISGVVGIYAIDGMAGVGKTAFAVHAAHRLSPRFPDGQIFLRLHAHTSSQQAVEPADALEDLLLTIGVSAQQIPPELETRSGLWRARMADKKVLLLLDDAASSDQVRPLLPGAADCLVVITSRRRLTALDGAVSISIDTLPAAEAAELFVRLADRTGLQPEDSAVAEATRLCGYLPLAIRLMAGRLSHRRSWTATDLVADLAAAQHRLHAMAAEKVSVAAAFDLSYRDLTPAQQHLFRHLGLNPGSDIDAYAAAALGNIDLADARNHLDDLYIHHLIEEPRRGRYRFHDLIREHAQSLAAAEDPADRDQAVDRLLDYQLHVASVAGRHLATRTLTTSPRISSPPTFIPELVTRKQAVAWLEAERSNLHASVEHAAFHQRPSLAIDLPAVIADFLLARGHWDQAFVLFRVAQNKARRSDDTQGEANILNYLGIVQYLKGEYSAASASLASALTLFQQLHNQPGEANVRNYLGIVSYLMGDYPAAVDNQTLALELFQDLGDRLGEANAHHYLAVVRYLTGRLHDAARGQGLALDLFRELGDQIGEANTLNQLGIVQYLTGDYLKASESLYAALEVFRAFADRYGEANTLTRLAKLQQLAGDYATALANQNRAIQLYRGIGSRYGEANALIRAGEVHYLMSNYSTAIESLTLALSIFRDLGNRHGEANSLNHLGVVDYLTGDYAAARSLLDQALELFCYFGDRYDEVNAQNNLGELLLTSATTDEARPLYEEALRTARELGAPLEEARSLEGLARCLIESGLIDDGRRLLNQALTLYRQVNPPRVQHVQTILNGLGR